MEVYGREIGFRLSMGAACDLADLCPGGDIKRIPEMISEKSPLSQQNGFAADMMVILSRHYENYRRFSEQGYTPRPLSKEEVMSLDISTFTQLLTEALDTVSKDAETTVPTVPVPGKKEEEAEQRSS